MNANGHIKQSIILANLFLTIAIAGCNKKDVFCEIRNGDYDLVVKGSYNGTADYIGQGENYTPAVKRCRRLIEKSLNLLPMITRRHFSAPGNLNFDFKMVLLDRAGNSLVLRYYAPIFGDQIVAGYQLFFVFDLSRDKLTRIFSSEVPLE
jgi:hypothetical protein